MKTKQTLVIRLLTVAMIPFFTATCVNNIQEETVGLFPSDIPIKISTNILCTQSRVSDDKFEDNDAIGLYVIGESQNLDESRYIDNMRFTCTSEGLVPDKEVFYPSGNNKCNFISYYPYQEKAIEAGKSSIKVAVNTNQSSSSGYGVSDFMVAKVSGLSSSTKSIKMDYQHKLCQLNIVIQLTENDNIQEVKENISVSVNKVYTQATYDFKTDAFTSLNTPQTIISNGQWIIDNGAKKLTGKKLLLIPQQATQGKISMRINGHTFSASLPDGLLLESNTSSEVVLHYDSKIGISKLEPSISEWQNGNSKDVTLEEEQSSFVHIDELDFGQTGVHQIVIESNTVIAELCKEYLLNDKIDAQAIVLYPAANKMQGTVVQVLNTSENVHGGSVTWDEASNSFTYTVGNRPPIDMLYVDLDGNIIFEKPTYLQNVSTMGYRLNDVRGTESTSYPIVKIGTQYWMGENLNTGKYNDGSDLPQINKIGNTAAGHFSNGNNKFYNQAAVTKGTLAPKGWKIPTNTEWEKLRKYVNNTAAVLKGGNLWATSVNISKANNKTGFNAQPIGLFGQPKDKNSSNHSFSTRYVAYWSMENSQTSLSENEISLKFDFNTIEGAKYNEYSGYSIRCIKE